MHLKLSFVAICHLLLFQVKTPKYNCPIGMYSETTMDEMVSGTSGLEWVLCFFVSLQHFSAQRVKAGPRGPGFPEDEELEEVRPKEELRPDGAQCSGDNKIKSKFSLRNPFDSIYIFLELVFQLGVHLLICLLVLQDYFPDEGRLCCGHWGSETSQVNEYNNIVLNSASNQITTATAKKYENGLNFYKTPQS